MQTDFDLIIRNGMIIDGEGHKRYPAAVGITRSVITEVGAIPAEAATTRTIDAAGLIVAPGFIDIHTHADIALVARPQHLPKLMQGVSTEVFTNCGLGFAPVSTDGMQIQRQCISGLFGSERAED
ncbi:MAG TPA: amidohydrolase family protein, partial [Chthonomonadales bacterium]|nr:amidohydrolase family protein [Chthonomonadales bacterium]